MSTRRLTGLQKQVLSLYRSVIRHTRSQDSELRKQILQYTRVQLEKNRNIERRNVMLIEHYLRNGKKKLELLEQGGVQGIGAYTSSS